MFVVCALYHFVSLDDCESLRRSLLDVMDRNSLRGTLLVAPEGINGTVAGSRTGVDILLHWFAQDSRFAGMSPKESFTDTQPFLRSKVKLKKEIVTMGVPDIDPTQLAGTYIPPCEWNRLIEDPAVTVIDTRNAYEVKIGTFRNALDPKTNTFREFPDFANAHLDPGKHKKIAMFCTGGIRCEKSTAYLKSLGFEDVYHLEGGILKYLEEVPEAESLWEGECFVFDDRVTVNQKLERGSYDQCHACRMPIDIVDKQSESYIPGVSCPHCVDRIPNDRRARFREREKQITLARERGEMHIGADARVAQESRKAEKQERVTTQRQSAGKQVR